VAQKHIGRQAGKFFKHVVPAAVKPVHSLWHEVLGFIFLAVAGITGFNVARHFSSMTPVKLALIIPLILVTAIYGVSSFLKARRISRS
jgi:CHASE2 domain-containing sensor protein